MRLRALPALAPVLVLLCAPTSAGATSLVGSSTVTGKRVSVRSGRVAAVPLVVRRSGSLRLVRVWVDRHTGARTLIVGVYTDRRGRPGHLLARGHRRRLRHRAWNRVAIGATPVVAGQRLWVALAARGGTLSYRAQGGSCRTGTTALRGGALPDTWSGAVTARRRCAPSVGVDGQPAPPAPVPVIPPLPAPAPGPPVPPPAEPAPDTDPPETTITVAPPGLTTASDASFLFESEAGATFECRLDGGAWNSCASPDQVSGLADGPHTFDVRAIDAVGNTDPTPATHAWTVDMSAPGVPAIGSGPSGLTNATAADFGFTGAGGDSFECRLDGGAWGACSSPKRYSGLGSGLHMFDVRAIDGAGNTSAAATRAWTVDAVPPGPPAIGSGPSGPIASPDATFAFSGESGGSFECRRDGGAWAACTSPMAYTGLGDGGHSFDVRATDAAGNTGPASTRTWAVDTAAPGAPAIGAGPSGTTGSTAASFAFTGEAGAGFECRLDGGAWGACASPKAYSGLADGSHTFEVRAKDGVGNTGPAATRAWTIDTTAPAAPAISSGPSGATNATSASFAFTGEAGASFECRRDGGAWGACTSPASYTGLTSAIHSFDVRATDAAGNIGATTTRTWTVDTTAPDTTLVSGPSGTTTATSATLTFTSEAGATFQCRIDAGAWGACTSPKTWTALALGAHTAEARASDAAGNTDATPASASWTVQAPGDTTPPTVSWTKPAAGQTVSGTLGDPTCEAAASDAGGIDRVEFFADGTLLNTERTAPYTCAWDTTKVANGSHTLRATAYDAAGNSRSADIAVTVANAVDTTPPDTSIDSGPSGTTSSTSASLGFSATEAGSSFQCRLDGGAWGACTSPKAYSSLANGAHTFDVRATDGAGNTDATPASRTWTVNTGVPPPPADLYMSPSGSDSNPCTDAQPCKSLTGTAAKGGANTTISMKPGTYAGQTVNTGSTGDCTDHLGDPTATTKCRRFVAQPGVHIGNLQISGAGTWITAATRGDLLIDGAYTFGGQQDVVENAIVDPATGDPGVYIDHATDFALIGSEVKGVVDNDGVDNYGGATGDLRTRIENNWIHDVHITANSCQHTDGIQSASTSGPSNTGTSIRGNTIEDVDQNAGIQLDTAPSPINRNEVIENNTIGRINYTPTSCVPSPYPRAITLSGSNIRVANNTMLQSSFIYPGSGVVTGNHAPSPSFSGGASCSTYSFTANVWSANQYGTPC